MVFFFAGLALSLSVLGETYTTRQIYKGSQELTGHKYENIYNASSATWWYGGAAKFEPSETGDNHVLIQKCNFTNCVSNFGGAAALENMGSLVVENCHIKGCSANSGGAFYTSGVKKVVIVTSVFTQCVCESTVGHYGGAIFCKWTDQAESVNVTQCVFEKCSSPDVGAAVWLAGDKVDFYNNVFTDCVIVGDKVNPEVVHITGANAKATDLVLKGCNGGVGVDSINGVINNITATNGAGCGAFTQGNVIVTDVKVTGCEKPYITTIGKAAWKNVLFTDNYGTGAVIANASTEVTYENVKFVNCSAKKAIAQVTGSNDKVTLTGFQITNCTVVEGSSLYVTKVGDLTVKDLVIYGCRGLTGGAFAFAADNGKVLITSCVIKNCEAVNGSAIYSQAAITIKDSEIEENKAADGAIHIIGAAEATLDNVIFTQNKGTKAYSAMALTLDNVAKSVVTNCFFDVSQSVVANTSTVVLRGENKDHKVTFGECCFNITADPSGDLINGFHIYSTYQGEVVFEDGMCFDLSRKEAVLFEHGQKPWFGTKIFNCINCKPSGLSVHAISGICAAASFGTIGIVFGIIFVVQKCKSRKQNTLLERHLGQTMESYTA